MPRSKCCIAGLSLKGWSPHVLYERSTYEPPVNGSSAVWHFEHGEVIKICDETIFGFYMGLSHVVSESTKRKWERWVEHCNNWNNWNTSWNNWNTGTTGTLEQLEQLEHWNDWNTGTLEHWNDWNTGTLEQLEQLEH